MRARRQAVLAVMIALVFGACGQDNSRTSKKAGVLHRVCVDELWGFVDQGGRMVIPPRFDHAAEFREGLAAVQEAAQWKYVDTSGKIVIETKYTSVGSFREGLAWVKQVSGGGLQGTFSVVVEPPKRAFGYIDRTGTLIHDLRFGFASDFDQGLAVVRENSEYHVIDKRGRTLAQPNYLQLYDGVGTLHEGLIPVSKNKKWGYAKATTEEAIPPQFEDVESFQEGLGAVKVGELWGFVGKNGMMVIPAQFEEVGDFSEGLAPVKIKGRYGYISKSGAVALAPQFELAKPFCGGLALVRAVEGKWNLIGVDGRAVWNSRDASREMAKLTDYRGPSPERIVGDLDGQSVRMTEPFLVMGVGDQIELKREGIMDLKIIGHQKRAEAIVITVAFKFRLGQIGGETVFGKASGRAWYAQERAGYRFGKFESLTAKRNGN
jgi:hypothetical protein